MRLKKLFLAACMLATAFGSAGLYAEEIMLFNLYAVMPLDNSKDTGYVGIGELPNYIIGGFDGNFVQIDFKKPAGNVQTIVRDHDGWTYHDRSFQNPESIHLDMQGAPAGRYTIEVYTDTEVVGGVFTINN